MQNICTKSYVINMSKDVQRWEFVKNEFSKYNIEPTRFNAIIGKNLDLDYYRRTKYISDEFHLAMDQDMYAAMGCAFSHISIWKDAYKNNYPVVSIFEDDISVNEKEIHNFESYYNQLPKDWDLCFLGVCVNKWPRNCCDPMQPIDDKTHVGPNILKLTDSSTGKSHVGCYAYIVSRSGIVKLLQRFSSMDAPVDEQIIRMKNLNTYAMQPSMFVHCNTFDSNINGISNVIYECDTWQYIIMFSVLIMVFFLLKNKLLLIK